MNPDFSHRSGTHMINDGRYEFARYFSLRERNTLKNWILLSATFLNFMILK